MSKVKKINVKLLRKVRRHILAEPKRVNMGRFIYRKEDCGTVACIAGWAVTLSGEELPYHISARAEELLGLNWRQASYLFYDAPNFVKAPAQTAEHARQTAKLIDHFIKEETNV
jgi:hypothetical protein